MPLPSVTENLLYFLSAFGILQGILLAALIYFHPKADKSVNRFLSLYILALTLPVILPIAQHFFAWQAITFIEPLITLICPFLYFYICSFKEVITIRKAWPHFILFFVCIALAILVYLSLGKQYPFSENMPDSVKNTMLVKIPFTLRLLQRIIYYFLCLRALRHYQQSIRHLFSDTSLINLNWMKWLINGFLFLLFIGIGSYFILVKYPEYFNWGILIPAAVVSVYIYMAAFKGITQTTLWQLNPQTDKGRLEEEINKASQFELQTPEKATTENVLNVKSYEIAQKVTALMENDKLYQEPELTLQQLAEKVRLPAYQVSQAINEGLNKTFYDLVNGYRVEEAKRLLADEKNSNFTILSVGFEAGFNSKTTFNTVFKKFTGMTPTEYRTTKIQTDVIQ